MRTVITKRNCNAAEPGYSGMAPADIANDSYRDRLSKYIPVETVVLYVSVYGCTYALISGDPLFPIAARWILIAGIVATPLWLRKAEEVTDGIQLAISTIGFILWGCALGVVPLTELPGYNQVIASLALPLYVFVSPLIEGIPERW
jgi:hypothetical protein